MLNARTKILLTTLGSLWLGGCAFEGFATGPLRNDPVQVDGGQAKRANVELDMGAGQLKIAGGAEKLLEGHFEYNVDSWKPQVYSSTNGAHATITIKQPSHGHGGGKTHYVWDLQINDHVLTDLTLNCGAGQAQLTLGTLTLRSLAVHMGAGQVQLDLRGEPVHDYEVTINGGVGQAEIQLPHGVGIWAEAHGGLGSLNITGLAKHGDHWENDAYGKAKVQVKVQVNGGIGEIHITA